MPSTGDVLTRDEAASGTPSDPKSSWKQPAPPAAHTHAAEDITSGTVDGARLPAMSETAKGAVPATGVPSGKFLRDDATWAAAGGGAGALSIAAAACPASLDVSAEGTIDWMVCGAAADPPQSTGYNVKHHKIKGGWLWRNWTVFSAGNLNTGIGNYGPYGISMTTAAGDDTALAMSATALGLHYVQTVSADVGCGQSVCIPAPTAGRVLRLYINAYSCKARVTASLSDGSHADADATFDSGGAANLAKMITVTFNSAHDGAELLVRFQIDTNDGSPANVSIFCATVSDS